MSTPEELAVQLGHALHADLQHVHQVARTMAAGIGEVGLVGALHAGYFMANHLPRDRVESMLVAALYALASEKTGTQALARARRAEGVDD